MPSTALLLQTLEDHGSRVLGVLCLARLQKNAFTQPDVDFLSRIAGQIAIAVDNALAYRQISELKDQLTQEKLYLEGELRSEMNFEEIIGNSAAIGDESIDFTVPDEKARHFASRS